MAVSLIQEPKLDFEDATIMGFKGEYAAQSLSASAEVAFSGDYSLEVLGIGVTHDNPANVRMVPPTEMGGGSAISAYAFLPESEKVTLAALAFAMDANWSWIPGTEVPLQPGKWTKVELTLDGNISLPLMAIGVQVIGGQTPWSGKFFIDAFDWKYNAEPGPNVGPVSPIRVDQVGYLSKALKIAKLTVRATEFYVVDSATSAIVFRGTPQVAAEFDPNSGDLVLDADFSVVQQAGRYRLSVPGVGASAEFTIGDDVYDEALQTVLKGFFYQRCGEEITNLSPWAHPACHLDDAYLWDSKGTRIDATGGWHDAGDYGKFVVTAAASVGAMLDAYELYPSAFARIDTQQSPGGLPALLEEVKWELDWLFKMQEADGGVHHKLAGERWTGNYPPHQDPGDRYVFGVSSAATADFAAVMAQAATDYAPYDPSFAGKALTAAELAWRWLADHPTSVPPGGFVNPPGVETAAYGDGDDSDERFWAAAELYKVAGNTEYNDYVRSHFQGSLVGPPSWAYVYPLGLVAYAASTWGDKDVAINARIREDVKGYADHLVAKALSDAYSTVLAREEYYWGSNGVVLNHAFMLLYADYFESSPVYREVAAEQIHYLLGRNANDKSYVTGIGLNPVRRPFHQYSMTGGMPEPVPGLLSGGPNSVQGSGLARFPAKAYVDNSDAYYVNETAIDMNAVLLFVLAGVASAP